MPMELGYVLRLSGERRASNNVNATVSTSFNSRMLVSRSETRTRVPHGREPSDSSSHAPCETRSSATTRLGAQRLVCDVYDRQTTAAPSERGVLKGIEETKLSLLGCTAREERHERGRRDQRLEPREQRASTPLSQHARSSELTRWVGKLTTHRWQDRR